MKSIVAFAAAALASEHTSLSEQAVNIVNDKLSNIEGEHTLATYNKAWTSYFDDANSYYVKFTERADLQVRYYLPV